MAAGRRRFLICALGGGGAILAGGWRGPARRESACGDPVTRRSSALGATVEFTVLGMAAERAHRAIDAAFAEVEIIEQVMSLYRPESQICRLNREGRLVRPHSALVEVLEMAARISEQTAGAFDVTVQPLWRLSVECRRLGRLPSADEIAEARSRVDWRSVECSPEEVRLGQRGMAVTLNGIAQGYAADRVRTVLAERGVEHALINAGEFLPVGSGADGADWRVGIQDPRQADRLLAAVVCDGRGIATSGDYETPFTPDLRHHHIFDPRTGESPPELASATILAPTTMEADALSTAAMVLGSNGTLEMIRQTNRARKSGNIDAMLVDKTGRTITTPGFPVADGALESRML